MAVTTTEYSGTHVGLTADQIPLWLDSFGNDPRVRSYLASGQPPYGIIVHVQQTADRFDDFLLFIPENPVGVWNPANLHIVLVTGNPIVESVNRAPYVSPDDIGFWGQLQKQLDNLFKGLTGMIMWAVVGLVAYAVIQWKRK